MSTHKYFDKICCVILALTLVLTILFMNAESLGIQKTSSAPGYETRLFDTSKVHTINIVMDNWDEFIESCTDEEYAQCSVVIDNEAYKNVAIRAKGNTSLSNVQSYGNDRYSFKIEFDHYDNTKTYYGLDKLSLNNIIQDNTYIKDYLTYQMMRYFGVSTPLCSYVQILVNGEEWGLYLAVEGVEESFLSRNYGNDYGELYKPDSMSMGGGRGNGGKFDMDDWQNNHDNAEEASDSFANSQPDMQEGDNSQFPGSGMQMPGGMGQQGDNIQPPNGSGQGEEQGSLMQQPNGSGMGGMENSDVSLIYSDDEYSSYSNIFDNAKTDISDTDKDRLIASLKKLNENSDIEDVVNVDEVIRYFVVHNFVCNFDSYTGSMIHNYYLYEEDGQLSMIPWDYNLAFGGFVGGSDATSLVNYPIDTPVSGGTVESRPMLSWIFESEEYTELYHQYFTEFISQYFDSGYFAEMIDSVKAMISPYVESDPTKFCTYEEFEKGINTLKEFCLLRAESVNAQLNGTIASTSDQQDNETLIDASALSISDMGSMDGGQGGGMDRPDQNGQGQMPENGNQGENNSSADQSGAQGQIPMGGNSMQQDGDAQGFPQDGDGQGMTQPDNNNEQNSSVPQMPGNGNQGENNSSADQSGAQGQTPMGGNNMPSLQNDGEMPNMPQDGNMQGSPQGDSGQEMTRPDNNGEQMGNQVSSSLNRDSYIMLGICTVVLLAGLLFALLYKKQV
ncbi:MAG: CotH kinase family protein [Erysipelotrichaceae bacterium]